MPHAPPNHPCALQVGPQFAAPFPAGGLLGALMSRDSGLATREDFLQLDGMTRLATTLQELSNSQVSLSDRRKSSCRCRWSLCLHASAAGAVL